MPFGSTGKKMETLAQRIERHEGRRNKSYKDSKGILTAGIGRNLEDVAFTDEEVDLMFKNDLARAREAAETFFVYQHLTDVRREVLIEMIFQMGIGGVGKFKRFLRAAQARDWEGARNEMLDSKWYREDSPGRALELANIFGSGRL
jgi:lysozyme